MQDRYRVVTGPPLSPPSASPEDLEDLAAALNGLEHPAAAALHDLTAVVELAFNALAPRDRQELLGSLGIRMAAPRRVSRTLCRDVLARLRRESWQHTCTCGTRRLTVAVINQVGRFVFARDGKTLPDPVTRWGGTLVRATLFAWCDASVADAYVLAWAADQDWFAAPDDEKSRAQFDAVAVAARTVVERYPDFAAGVAEDEEPLLAGDRKHGRQGADRPVMGAFAPKTAERDSDTSHGMTAPAPEGIGNQQESEPEAACRELESALAQARHASEKVTDAVADGRPPQDADLAALAALATAFDNADAVFSAAGIDGVPRRLDEMMRAARTHRMEYEQALQARQPLRELLNVMCPPESPAAAAAEAVRDVARRLLDAPAWDQTQREESAALAALLRLIELRRQADAAAEILALQDQVARVLPACATAAFMAPELTLAQPEDTSRRHPEAGADTDGPSGTEATTERGDTQPTERKGETTGHLFQEDVGQATEVPVGQATESTAPEPAPVPEAAAPARPRAQETVDGPGAQTATRTDSASAPRPQPVAPVPAPTRAAPQDQDEPVRDEATGDRPGESAAERALAQLVVERRFGLAHHVARAAGHPEPQVAALRLAGAAALLTSGDSQVARLTADLLQEYGGYAGRDTEGCDARSMAPGIIARRR